MKRKVLSRQVILTNTEFKSVIQESTLDRKRRHEAIVKGAKDAGIIAGLASSSKKKGTLSPTNISAETCSENSPQGK